MLPPCPQNRFGFSSDCIVCWDHALNAFVEEFRWWVIPIILVSFFFGLNIKRSNIFVSIAGTACLTGIFLVYYMLSSRNQIDWIYHLEHHARNAEAITCLVKDIATRAKERAEFIAACAWKSWVLFGLVPFLLGLLINVTACYQRDRSAKSDP